MPSHALDDPLHPVNLLRIGVRLIQVDLPVLQLGRDRELQAGGRPIVTSECVKGLLAAWAPTRIYVNLHRTPEPMPPKIQKCHRP